MVRQGERSLNRKLFGARNGSGNSNLRGGRRQTLAPFGSGRAPGRNRVDLRQEQESKTKDKSNEDGSAPPSPAQPSPSRSSQSSTARPCTKECKERKHLSPQQPPHLPPSRSKPTCSLLRFAKRARTVDEQVPANRVRGGRQRVGPVRAPGRNRNARAGQGQRQEQEQQQEQLGHALARPARQDRVSPKPRARAPVLIRRSPQQPPQFILGRVPPTQTQTHTVLLCKSSSMPETATLPGAACQLGHRERT